jgi:hypothetical protein
MNNRTPTGETIRKNYSPYLTASNSLPKNKKKNTHNLNHLSKIINILSRNNKINRNKYFNKKDNEKDINQNNYIKEKEKASTNTIENRSRIINYIKLLKIKTSFFTKMNKAKDFTSFMKSNNSHFNKIMIKSHKKNSFKSDKNNSKIKEIHLYNIYKDMMLFKRKINRIKKADIYSSNTKLIKRKNLNNFSLRKKIYRNQKDQNNQTEPAISKKDFKIKNVNNSFIQNINLYYFRKSINNINNNCSNSLLLTNINNNKNLMNQNKNTISKENLITNFKPINKYNTYIINHYMDFKDSKSKANRKRKIMNDININLNNLTEKNNLLNINTIKKNTSELKCKINNILININNNSHNNILQKNKSHFSCKNKAKKINYKFE